MKKLFVRSAAAAAALTMLLTGCASLADVREHIIYRG